VLENPTKVNSSAGGAAENTDFVRISPGHADPGRQLDKQVSWQVGIAGVVGLLAGKPTRDATDHPIEDRVQVLAGRCGEQRER
jgi:hypothetical protein